jgi:hypothetical protein
MGVGAAVLSTDRVVLASLWEAATNICAQMIRDNVSQSYNIKVN